MEYGKEAIDGLNVRFGSPFYLFDERGFIENYRALDAAMRELCGVLPLLFCQIFILYLACMRKKRATQLLSAFIA